MPTVEPIKIDGLGQFARNLRTLDNELPKALRQANNEAANVVVEYARPKVPLGPNAGGHARSSLRARSIRTAVRVSAGGKRYPYYPWLDFGGRVGRNRSVRRPFLRQGRYIWAGFSENYETVWRTLHDALIDVARRAGVEVD